MKNSKIVSILLLYKPQKGCIYLNDKSGFGLDLNPESIERYRA